jgi:uncharacterized protein (TIGR00303 family)
MSATKIISGNKKFINKLKTDNASIRLIGSYTKTCEIENISAAGLPGYLHLTPAADMEFLFSGKLSEKFKLPESPEGPPSPVIISSSVKEHFNIPVSLIDAGLKVKPNVSVWECEVKYSNNICEGANVDAYKLISKGIEYAHQCSLNELEIIAECVPGGTTTAYSLCKALGYQCDNLFSSSSTDEKHKDLKKKTVEEAINKFGYFDNPLTACNFYGDNMQPFAAALASKLSLKTNVILAGGTQMLAVYALMKKLNMPANYNNIAIITTKWIINDKNSNFIKLASMIDKELNSLYSDFTMTSDINNLALYEKGYVKEGVGAGALTAYAFANGMTEEELLKEIERKYLKLNNKKALPI